jgi:hypothetical protein
MILDGDILSILKEEIKGADNKKTTSYGTERMYLLYTRVLPLSSTHL